MDTLRLCYNCESRRCTTVSGKAHRCIQNGNASLHEEDINILFAIKEISAGEELFWDSVKTTNVYNFVYQVMDPGEAGALPHLALETF